MKKKIGLIIICIFIIAGICIKHINENSQPVSRNSVTENNKAEGVIRGQAARMIGYLFFSENEINNLERVIVYSDTGKEKWYDKYINALYTLGITEEGAAGEQTKFRPSDYLTAQECIQTLKRLEIFCKEEKKSSKLNYKSLIKELSFDLEKLSGNRALDRKKWDEIYKTAAKQLKNDKIKEKELFFIDTGKPEKEDWKINTGDGIYKAEGMELHTYREENRKVLVRDNQILSVLEKGSNKAVLRNVWLIDGKGKEITGYFNGNRCTFSVQETLSQTITKVIGDLTIENKKVTKVGVKPDVINGKVLASTDKYIEIEGYGKVPVDGDFKIYKVFGELTSELSNGILSGYHNTDFVVSAGKICAALIKEEIKAKDIRVLIKTSNFKSLFHSGIQLTANCDYTVQYKKQKKKYKAGKKFKVEQDSELLKSGRIRITPDKEDGKIQVLSIKRGQNKPKYRGTMEISKNKDGLILINELSLEEYLYAVLPSEMSPGSKPEALKAQAVCARSYAYNHLMQNHYSEYGAHVDDSVSYQVYNNQPETKETIRAVQDSFGKVMEYNGKVITAYYFSTSCGHTSSANEVWAGSSAVPYLQGQFQRVDGRQGSDLSSEVNFRKFLNDKKTKTYDSSYPWYRWQVKYSEKKLKDSIDLNLNGRYKANPSTILTLDKDKAKNMKKGKKDIFGNPDAAYRSIPVGTVGKVKDIKINKRGTGGIAMEMIIKGSENTVKVISEYNIRTVLAPISSELKRKDGSRLHGLNMLPSAFFVIDKYQKAGKFSGITVRGGGYGHGVGMSQNGVKTMAELGMKYEQILKHYYNGIQLGSIY